MMAINLTPPTTRGILPETSSLQSVLETKGVTAPHTGKPYSEAMILGMGGLGAGYILWEFRDKTIRSLVLAFHKNFQYPDRFIDDICSRLSLNHAFNTTGGEKKAFSMMREALENGEPPVLWVDYSGQPYLFPGRALGGNVGHIVTVYRLDEENDRVWVYDRGLELFPMSLENLALSRARIGSFKHKMLVIRPKGEEPDLETAIKKAVEGTVDHLSKKSDSFSLPTFRKWARLLTDPKHTKGWPTVFADGKGLYGVLKNVYEETKGAGAGGGSLRGLYADFLQEAAVILPNTGLEECAEAYRTLEQKWVALGEAALPDEILAFRTTKDLLEKRHALLGTQGFSAQDKIENHSRALNTMHREYNADFPMEPAARLDLFAQLQTRLQEIYNLEIDALDSLHDLLKSV